MKWYRRDAGAFTPMVAVIAASLFAMVALAVDGGGRMRTLEHADDLAAEAARAGGQALSLPQAVSGTADVINQASATEVVDEYLKQAGVTTRPIVQVSPDGREITVTVTISYQPVMLDLLDLGPWTETGTATAVLVTR
jgi:Flp pilus assembly protein TadG